MPSIIRIVSSALAVCAVVSATKIYTGQLQSINPVTGATGCRDIGWVDGQDIYKNWRQICKCGANPCEILLNLPQVSGGLVLANCGEYIGN
jgi:hypothetical protein